MTTPSSLRLPPAVARPALYAVLAVLGMWLITGDALAQTNDPAAALQSGILDRIKDKSVQWSPILLRYARTLFWTLAVIEFVWAFHPLVFKGADIGEILGDLVRVVLTIGFFLFLMESFTSIGPAIVDSLQIAGSNAAGVPKELPPGKVFHRGMDLGMVILDTPVGYNPIDAVPKAIGLVVAAAVIFLSFAFIAAFIAVTLVQSWVVIYGGVLFMGLGGSRWTREYAVSVVKYCLGVGAKLFVMVLIVGLVSDVALEWSNDYRNNPNEASMWTIVALAAICAYLVKTLPEMFMGMISGTSTDSGHSVGGLVAGAVAASVAAASMTKAVAGSVTSTTGSSSGGGLAHSLNSSLAHGPTSSSVPSSMQHGAPGSPGSAPQAAHTAGYRIGGGIGQPSTRSAPAVSPLGDSFTSRPQGGAANERDNLSGPASDAQSPERRAVASLAKAGTSVATAADIALRSAGTLAGLAMPGAEGAPTLSGVSTPAPAPDEDHEGHTKPPASVESAENIIRPATSPSEPPQAAYSATGAVSARSLGALRVPGMNTPSTPEGGAA